MNKMKKIIVCLFLILWISRVSWAQIPWFASFNGNFTSVYNQGGWGADIGLYNSKSGHATEIGWLFGGGVSILGTGQRPPSGYLDYPCPHSDYTTRGWYYSDDERGFEIKAGIEIAPRLFAIGGFAWSQVYRNFIVQSNVTGWYYSQYSTAYSFPSGLVEIRYFGPRSQLFTWTLGLGYNPRRSIYITGGVFF